MKRRDLTALNFKLLEDKKINQIYFRFRENILSVVGKEKFAIAVSGGSDSLALSILAKLYSLEQSSDFATLIVDHGLRKESANEAKKTFKNLKKNNIKAEILTYRGSKFTSNIQKKARDLRYDLFQKYCKKNKIKFLILAHHQDDLIENFYIRLIRGSGIKGLTSLQNVSELNKDFYLLRPLLHFKKEELLNLTKKIFSTWIEDPSNLNEKFLRVRIRKMQSRLQKEGFDPKRVLKTIENLNTAKNSLDFYILKSEKKYLNFFKEGYATLKSTIFKNEAPEVIFRVIIKAIKNWDDRFLVYKNFDNQQKFIVKKLGNSGIDYLKKNKFISSLDKIPVQAKKTLPSFWNHKGELMFVPFINFKNRKYNIKNDSFAVRYLRFI